MTATLGAVDKVAISTAAIYGLKDDLHLVGQQYSWAGSILFLGVGDTSIGGLVFAKQVTGHCWHVAIHVSGPPTPFCQIPLCMLVRLVSPSTSLARLSQLEWTHGLTFLHGYVNCDNPGWATLMKLPRLL
jgi:hypothetical protein